VYGPSATERGAAIGLLAALALFGSACSPDVPSNPSPPSTVVAQLDLSASPPVAPSPNDLAIDPKSGLVAVPPSLSDSDAQREFDTEYLGTLSGFPFESVATVAFSGPLDPTTVTAKSVVAFDLGAPGAPAMPSNVAAPVSYDATHNVISMAPPPGGWTRAHRYAVALLAGPGGLKGANGEAVVGSPTWQLLSSPDPLVTDCPNGDLHSPQCALAVDVIPSNEVDPTRRQTDQLLKAQQLEAIRTGYAPLLATIQQAEQVTRDQIPLAWTFTIVDAAEVTFDPAHGVIPFPNDVVRVGGKVNLPNPTTGMPLTAADCASSDPSVLLYCGLNTLDGF